MLIVIGIWKINSDLNKSIKINPSASNNLALPPFPKLEEKLGELNKGINDVEKLDEEDSESFEDSESGEKVEESKIYEELEN